MTSGETLDRLRDRMVTVEWLRRRLASTAPDCAATLAAFGDKVGPEVAVRVLLSEIAGQWLTTMLRLVDRDAPRLLPDGQFAAHAASVVNLVAGHGQGPWPIRFDADGAAHLPFLQVTVSGDLGRAGSTAWFDPTQPGDLKVEPLQHAVRPSPPTGAEAPQTEPVGVNECLASAALERWRGAGGTLANPPDRTSTWSAPDALADLVARTGIPDRIAANPPGGDRIRSDATFDHLSLLSVRQPAAFAELEAAVAGTRDPYSRRLAAHCAYIRRRPAEAASTYAELLLDAIEDVDLWRDFCWALRHAGQEDVTRVWVLFPSTVVRIAASVTLNSSAPSSAGSDDPATMLASFLMWVSDDLR